jgi:hypothetical protein
MNEQNQQIQNLHKKINILAQIQLTTLATIPNENNTTAQLEITPMDVDTILLTTNKIK